MENIETTTVEIVYNFINTLDLQQLEKMKKNILEDMELELPVEVMEDRVKELRYLNYRIESLTNNVRAYVQLYEANDKYFKFFKYDYSIYLDFLNQLYNKMIKEGKIEAAKLVQRTIAFNI